MNKAIPVGTTMIRYMAWHHRMKTYLITTAAATHRGVVVKCRERGWHKDGYDVRPVRINISIDPNT